MAEPVRVGLLGCGVVGSATARILVSHASELETRTGARIEVARIAVRDVSVDRGLHLPDAVWTTDPWEVVRDPSIDVIVEVIGGVEPARELIL